VWATLPPSGTGGRAPAFLYIEHLAAVKFSDLLRPAPAGLYCPPGDFYIDPTQPVDGAVITHGHGDHARRGHGAVLATKETLAIMAVRYGEDFAGATETAGYGQTIRRGEVEVTLYPAGHILGSAQCAITWKGMTIVVSGDYKRRRDPTCRLFEPVACDVFVTEATFGLPVFRHPPDSGEIQKLLRSLQQFPERAHLVGAYALGKAQRVICLLREAGYGETIYVHGALMALDALYENFGVALGPLAPATTDLKNKDTKDKFEGRIVIAPPAAIADKWARRFADPLPAFASGWMRVRARARQRHVELPLILSDHGDWDELTGTIAELTPRELWITHGNDEALLRWSALNGIDAKALSLVGYEDEEV
jgi:putative mRNA 3-end processing factor